MDPQYALIPREEVWRLHEEMKTVHAVQGEHSERLSRLERRQEDDARLKSVWGASSPFPSVLSGTPQQEPVQNPPGDEFNDFDENHEQNLLGSLQLDHDREPRRGTSRANSVRFDESAKHGHWPRSSADLFPIRTSSALGSHPMTERSLSHKSDGRQSSAGQSVHSAVSAHSARTNSLGLDASFPSTQAVGTPFESTGPPPGFFVLGTVPSIIRCWIDTNFSNDSLLYAVVCPGSCKSFLDLHLAKRLGLTDQLSRSRDGELTIKLPVYLPEAVVQRALSRSASLAPRLPSVTTTFTISGQHATHPRQRSIQVFLGSDTLRRHGADILLSQNTITLLGDDHSKLSVPLVRPEDENLFKSLRTVSADSIEGTDRNAAGSIAPSDEQIPTPDSTTSKMLGMKKEFESVHNGDETGEGQRHPTYAASPFNEYPPSEPSLSNPKRRSAAFTDPVESCAEGSTPESTVGGGSRASLEGHIDNNQVERDAAASHEADSAAGDSTKRDASGNIWGSWRRDQGPRSDNAGSGPSTSSGYQKPGRGRGMKVLRPAKSSISSSRSNPNSNAGVEGDTVSRRDENDAPGSAAGSQTDERRSMSGEARPAPVLKLQRSLSNQARAANPVGGASAFGWLNGSQPKRSAAAAD